MNKRYLFIRLPYFPTERFLKNEQTSHKTTIPWWDEQANHESHEKPQEQGPLVLVQHGVKGTRISAVSPEAEALGIWPDMKLADARAMVPHLRVEQHDISAERNSRKSLARWLMRYSPAVALYEMDGFLLNTSGCDHLFGGEHQMARDVSTRMKKAGFSIRSAFSDHPAACVALTNFGAENLYILPPDHKDNLLDGLPVEALRLDADCVTLLKRLGLKRIGDVRKIPRVALERRFRDSNKSIAKVKATAVSQSVQLRLDQLNGSVSQPLSYVAEHFWFCASLNCPDLALDLQAVENALHRLLPDLCQQLIQAGNGGRHFRLMGYRANGGVSWVDIKTSQPSRSAALIARLFRDKLEQIDCGYGVDLFQLHALNTQQFHTGQHDMLDADAVEQSTVHLAHYVDTVANRIGARNVAQFMPRSSHVPERAQVNAPALKPVSIARAWDMWQVSSPLWSPRPLRLFEKPEPAEVTAELPDSPPMQFVWRRKLRRIVRARGPECIMPEWWHDNLKSKNSAIFRDYYDVEDSEGLRYWIFRSLKKEAIDEPNQEVVDGKSSEESDAVYTEQQQEVMTISWFVHGLF